MKKRKLFKQDEKAAYLLLAFPLIWWGIFFLFAFIRAIYFSFTDLTVDISAISEFNLNNYSRLFQDEVFLKAIKNTLIWTVVMTLFNNFFGLMIAYFITKIKRGQKLFLTLLFWPTLVSSVISADITKLVFSPSDTGLMNTILRFLNLEPLYWYNDERLSLITLMILPMLLGFSTQMMIYYVAIKGVDRNLVEAAKMDGATNGQILVNIYLPCIVNSIGYNLILSIIGGVKVIAPMHLVSNGGPLDSSMSIMLYLYQNTTTEMGYACSIGVVTLLIILGLTFVQMKLTPKESD